MKGRTARYESYFATPELRSKLVVSAIGYAQIRLDFIRAKKHRWAEGTYSIRDVLDEIQEIDARLTGEEIIDKVRWTGLLSDLRALNAEQGNDP